MNKQLTEMVLILDRSGSMHGLEADTIGGFNSTIEKQKKVDGKAFVTTVLFDDVSEVIHDRVDLQKVKPITSNEYFVRGCTALLDAVGSTINHIKGIHKYARPEDVPAHTVVVITTDGYENASRKFTRDQVKSMIAEQEKAGWEFVFLGANIDAVEAAGEIGIPRAPMPPGAVSLISSAALVPLSPSRHLGKPRWKRILQKESEISIKQQGVY